MINRFSGVNSDLSDANADSVTFLKIWKKYCTYVYCINGCKRTYAATTRIQSCTRKCTPLYVQVIYFTSYSNEKRSIKTVNI